MKNKIKTSALVCSLLVTTACVAFPFGKSYQGEPVIVYKQSDFAIDVNSMPEVVGYADYYFVAKIVGIKGTEYRHKVTVRTEDGFKTVGDPYTVYEILVTKNIKGELPTDTPIKLTKSGGITKDGRNIVISENDSLMNIGETYIISAFGQPDGTILASGPNSNHRYQRTRSSNYESNYTNEKHFNRERFSFKQ